MPHTSRLTFFCMALVLSGAAWANDPTPVAPDRPATLAEIVQQQTAFREQMNHGEGRFEKMPAIKQSEIARNQTIIFRLLDGKQQLDQLSPKENVEAINALEAINAAIANTADERIVCERTKPIYTNRIVRVCRSVAQIAADREAGRKEMMRNGNICRRGCVDVPPVVTVTR